MDKLPQCLVVEILSRLDDSADVARCRLASKIFDTVSSDLRSINLQCSLKRYIKSRSRVSNSSSSTQITTPFKTIFLNLVSNLRVVESVCIGAENPLIDLSFDDVEDEADDMYLTDGDFVKEWLPRVSGGLKWLSISDFWIQSCWRRSDLLPLVSVYCHNLLELEVKNAWLSVENLNPMPMLTSLTLELTTLDDEDLNELNKCFPNLQDLNLIGVGGLKLPKIRFLNLKTFHWAAYNAPLSLTIITPNLTLLRLECKRPTALYVEAPMLLHLHLALDEVDLFTFKKFENLKTLWLESVYLGSLVCKFPITKTLENLIVNSRKWVRGDAYSKFIPEKVFSLFPSVNLVSFNSRAWSELEACYNPEGWEKWDGRKSLKFFRAYLLLVDPSLTFSSLTSVFDQCVGLVEVLLLIHRDVVADVSKSFMSRCTARWPRLKWRWAMWKEGMKDSWITD